MLELAIRLRSNVMGSTSSQTLKYLQYGQYAVMTFILCFLAVALGIMGHKDKVLDLKERKKWLIHAS